MSSSLKNTYFSTIKAHYDIVLFMLCITFFIAFPQLDLVIASQFFNDGFYWNENPVIKFIYKLFAKIHLLYLLVFIVWIIVYWVKKNVFRRYAGVYLLCTLLLGPGLLVNILLKDNSVGRPRPVHITEFDGKMAYTPVFHYSGECHKNCSFVSGHASIGFYTMALFWVTRKRRWLLGGLALGAAVGFTRIVQGGHFFSDVIFAGWAVYFCCAWLSKAFKSKF